MKYLDLEGLTRFKEWIQKTFLTEEDIADDRALLGESLKKVNVQYGDSGVAFNIVRNKAPNISENMAIIRPATTKNAGVMSAEDRVQFNEMYTKVQQIPGSTSQLTNDSGFITSADIPATETLTNDEIDEMTA